MIDFKHRTATEVVVILFTLLILIEMLMITSGVMLAKILHPDLEFAKAGEAINNMLSTIIGALVGFISGRAYGRREQQQYESENGKKRDLE